MTPITLPRAVVEQALEALENAEDHLAKPYSTDASKAITALRAALAQQAEPVEPVACPACEELGYVPLSEDGRSVFIDGVGEVPLAQQAEPVEPVACANMEPSSAQLKSILDGLARCHVEQSASEFLRAWIRDWTAHKVYAPPQHPDTDCHTQGICQRSGYGIGKQAEPVQEPITDYWYQHYVVDGLCGLCGNRGVIDTRGTTTPAGVAVGGLHYCICPNGQTMRRNKAALAEPVLQTCNCRWDGDVQVQQCTLHEAHVDAIHEWAERAKVAERKLAQQAEPVEPVACPACEELGYVPLSEDGRSVFIDGVGEVPLAQQAEPQNTHSTECWRWHHKCAVAKIERECKHD